MLDPQLLRNNTEEVARVLRPRGYLLDVERFQNLEKDRKQLQMKQQERSEEHTSELQSQ